MSGFDQASMVDQAALEAEQAEELAFMEEDFESLYSLMWEKNNDPYMKSLRKQISDLEKQLAEISEPYDAAIRDYQESIRNGVLQLGKSFKCPHGSATFRKAHERASWDDKKLQGYAIQNPEILTCRNVTNVAASVTLRVGGEQK